MGIWAGFFARCRGTHLLHLPGPEHFVYWWRGYHDRYLKWRSHYTLFKVAMLPRSLFRVEEPLGEVGVDALPQLSIPLATLNALLAAL